MPFAAEKGFAVYFDLGQHLIEEFNGTYEFKYKRIEFSRVDSSTYIARSTGDQSPSENRLIEKDGYVLEVHGSSGEQWIKIRNNLRRGDWWIHNLRGWKQTYKVEETNIALVVPAGKFEHCVKITISWIAHEHDMEGPQKVVLYLAPHLGVIKREYWAGEDKEHEEVLAKYSTK